jgi:hypothetical protein
LIFQIIASVHLINMKELYTFTIKDGDKERKVFLKKPGARDQSLISEVWSAELSKALKKGIMSKNDLRRTLSDDGGLQYSKQDKATRIQLIKDLNDAENKYQKLSLEKKDLAKITKKILEIRTQINEMDAQLVELFGSSAEVIANQKTILWAAVNLTFWDEDKSYVFVGQDDEERLAFYYNSIDDETVEKSVAEKAYTFFQAFLLEGYKDREAFEALDKNIDELAEAQKKLS